MNNCNKPVIFIGHGTCGMGAGAAETYLEIEKFLVENKIDASLVKVGCIGLCSQEPIVDISLPGHNRISFGKVEAGLIHKLLGAFFQEKSLEMKHVLFQFYEGKAFWKNVPTFEDHPFFSMQERRVLENCGLIDPLCLDSYIQRDGYLALKKALKMSPQEVTDEVLKSGLRGRGGGGFPTGRKWNFARSVESDKKYFICNADEGDPGAFMDRAVIESDPHKLLEGLIISSYAIGASKAYVYIRAEYPLAIKNLEHAIDVAYLKNYLGKNILGSEYSLDVIIKQGAGAFVCGEETALINSIEGKRGMPRLRPPFPAIKGLFDKPTIINNVETLANVPLIIRNGSEWYNSVGTDGSKGTKVFALSGKTKQTGLIEVPMGTSVRTIVFNIGEGIENGGEYKAAQMGGPSGGCVPSQHLDIEIDYESLKKIGAMMGSGGLVVMDNNTCMIDVAKYFMGFIQRESCGKCIPCREGTRELLRILEMITSKNFDNAGKNLDRFKGIMNMQELAEVIKDTSLCGLGQTAPNPVLSTLRFFRDEYNEHIFEHKCRSRVCTDFISYCIDEDNCKGCTICAKKCPVGAIKGNAKNPHYILEEKCIKCGLCLSTCKFNAVKKVSI